jgi:hypothetical protein
MSTNQFSHFMAFLERLEVARIRYYTLAHTREDAITVSVVSPGTYWEIDFLEDGTVEVERYVSTGKIEDESILEGLFEAFSDEATVSHDNTRK